MPRHPRRFLPVAIYHVYIRIGLGKFVFDDEFEAIVFITPAAGRDGLCVLDVATPLRQHPNSFTKRLNMGPHSYATIPTP